MRWRVSTATGPFSLMTRETVAMDTPALRATSLMEALKPRFPQTSAARQKMSYRLLGVLPRPGVIVFNGVPEQGERRVVKELSRSLGAPSGRPSLPTPLSQPSTRPPGREGARSCVAFLPLLPLAALLQDAEARPGLEPAHQARRRR